MAGSCASSGSSGRGAELGADTAQLDIAADRFHEGNYYLGRFEQFRAWAKGLAGPTGGDSAADSRYGEIALQPYWLTEGGPSEQDIDRAVAAFEEAAGLAYSNELYRERLEEAKRIREEWLAVEKPEIERRLAAAQESALAQQQQAAEERNAQEGAYRTVTEDMFQIRHLPDSTVEIIKYTGDVENVVIPLTFGGLPVTVIGEGAFKNNKEIRSVVIPDTVTKIAARAFYNCRLTYARFGSGLEVIGGWAFQNNNLITVTLPAGLREVGNKAFSTARTARRRENNTIRYVSIPEGIERVVGSRYSYGIFAGNTINSAVLPANISGTAMGNYGFEAGLVSFYARQDGAAGTYVRNGTGWTKY
ncbi:MAG: leucine-rich repeat domain-containing protein [Treponema sp.]|nr:leucine-rich repeat domain-containing protein [Treponema sp.]